MIAPRVESRRPLATALLALVALCWMVLVAWGQSPYGRFLGHGALIDLGGDVGPRYVVFVSAFLAGWVLMIGAMMLPTVLPLVLLFQSFTAHRHGAALTALLLTGYVLAWGAFGTAVHLADLALHTAVAHSHWLREHAWLLAAGAFGLAGAYQFTPLKDFCLTKCRSPFQFIVAHWHGRTPKADAFWLGVHHGLFCLGCCWALMLVMFAVGMGNVAWMLGLGAIMTIEKNVSWGRRLSIPLGAVLLGIACVLAFGSDASSACAHDGGPCASQASLIADSLAGPILVSS